MKTINISQTKPNNTKAWFSSVRLTPSSQVTDGAYSLAPGVCTLPIQSHPTSKHIQNFW